MIQFISGHIDLTEQEFSDHYARPIFGASLDGDDFVLGDAAGADRMAADYLWSLRLTNPDIKVTVFHMFDAPRYNPGFPTQGGYQSDDERDSAMTEASDADIAWVRSGREKSGTAKNLARRKKTCPRCDGWGDDKNAPDLDCPQCDGSGAA